MIARFEGGPWDGLTLQVHGWFEDFQVMGLLVVDASTHSHELVPGHYRVRRAKSIAESGRYEWDGPAVEPPGVLPSTEPRVDDPDVFVERRSDVDRRTGHTMGRRSFRGDRRDRRERAVNWCELRRVKQRRDPKNQRREDHPQGPKGGGCAGS